MEKKGIRCFEDALSLSEAAAVFILDSIGSRIEKSGRCTIALAGGNTPRIIYRRMADPDMSSRVDWSKVLVRFGDERLVPPESALSNYKMAKDNLLDHVPLPAENVVPIRSELSPARAAALYAREIDDSPLDIVLLGLGEDGHTASLFGDAGVAREDSPSVVATISPVPPRDRVSLSLGAINRARLIVFLVVGGHKKKILGKVIHERNTPHSRLPAAMVRPAGGEVCWFVDRSACGDLCQEQGENHG